MSTECPESVPHFLYKSLVYFLMLFWCPYFNAARLKLNFNSLPNEASCGYEAVISIYGNVSKEIDIEHDYELSWFTELPCSHIWHISKGTSSNSSHTLFPLSLSLSLSLSHTHTHKHTLFLTDMNTHILSLSLTQTHTNTNKHTLFLLLSYTAMNI